VWRGATADRRSWIETARAAGPASTPAARAAATRRWWISAAGEDLSGSAGRRHCHPLILLPNRPLNACRHRASAVLASQLPPHHIHVTPHNVFDRCCNGALDAGGRCCPLPAVMDEFGVCSGSSTSGTMVMSLAVVANAPGGSQDGATPRTLANAMAVHMMCAVQMHINWVHGSTHVVTASRVCFCRLHCHHAPSLLMSGFIKSGSSPCRTVASWVEAACGFGSTGADVPWRSARHNTIAGELQTRHELTLFSVHLHDGDSVPPWITWPSSIYASAYPWCAAELELTASEALSDVHEIVDSSRNRC